MWILILGGPCFCMLWIFYFWCLIFGKPMLLDTLIFLDVWFRRLTFFVSGYFGHGVCVLFFWVGVPQRAIQTRDEGQVRLGIGDARAQCLVIVAMCCTGCSRNKWTFLVSPTVCIQVSWGGGMMDHASCCSDIYGFASLCILRFALFVRRLCLYLRGKGADGWNETYVWFERNTCIIFDVMCIANPWWRIGDVRNRRCPRSWWCVVHCFGYFWILDIEGRIWHVLIGNGWGLRAFRMPIYAGREVWIMVLL